MKRVLIIVVLLFIGSVVIVASLFESPKRQETNGGQIIYATFYPYHEFVKGVAGNAIKTGQLAPNGIQIHDWEPNARDIQDLHNAVGLVFSNTYAEPYVGRLAKLDELAGITFIAASPYKSGVHDETVPTHDKNDGHDDIASHSWLDPVDAIKQVNYIRNGLVTVDPENAPTYEQNADMYIKKLERLDEQYSTGLIDCQHNTIITFHNAYEHLAKRYDLEVFGTASAYHAESSVRAIASMIDYAKDNNPHAIFAGELSDSRHELAVADELGIGVVELSTLEGLRNQEEATYFEKMVQNLDALREGLQCR